MGKFTSGGDNLAQDLLKVKTLRWSGLNSGGVPDPQCRVSNLHVPAPLDVIGIRDRDWPR